MKRVAMFCAGLVGGFVASCVGLPSSVIERKINWPADLVCIAWEKARVPTDKGPMLLAADAKNDVTLQSGHRQSCFSNEDVKKIEKRLAELEQALKACQSQ